MSLSLLSVEEATLRENFRRIEQYLRDQAILRGEFKFFEATIRLGANTVYHDLGFVPKDVILTAFDENGQAPVFEYRKFTKDSISINASLAGDIRFFLGTYSGGRT